MKKISIALLFVFLVPFVVFAQNSQESDQAFFCRMLLQKSRERESRVPSFEDFKLIKLKSFPYSPERAQMERSYETFHQQKILPSQSDYLSQVASNIEKNLQQQKEKVWRDEYESNYAEAIKHNADIRRAQSIIASDGGCLELFQ